MIRRRVGHLFHRSRQLLWRRQNAWRKLSNSNGHLSINDPCVIRLFPPRHRVQLTVTFARSLRKSSIDLMTCVSMTIHAEPKPGWLTDKSVHRVKTSRRSRPRQAITNLEKKECNKLLEEPGRSYRTSNDPKKGISENLLEASSMIPKPKYFDNLKRQRPDPQLEIRLKTPASLFYRIEKIFLWPFFQWKRNVLGCFLQPSKETASESSFFCSGVPSWNLNTRKAKYHTGGRSRCRHESHGQPQNATQIGTEAVCWNAPQTLCILSPRKFRTIRESLKRLHMIAVVEKCKRSNTWLFFFQIVPGTRVGRWPQRSKKLRWSDRFARPWNTGRSSSGSLS